MSTSSSTATIVSGLGHEFFRRVVHQNGMQPWHAEAYLNEVEKQVQSLDKQRHGNWARRVRQAVEKDSGFKAAVALLKM